jgi:D-glucosaminate-6-phosphate ammonia-lyase
VPLRAPALTVAGNWELQLDLLHGARVHRLNLEQRGASLTGHQRSAQFDGPISGALDGDVVRFTFGGRYEASNISFHFEGTVADGRMTGRVELGAASDQNAGVVNRSQFGGGEWRATRLA